MDLSVNGIIRNSGGQGEKLILDVNRKTRKECKNIKTSIIYKQVNFPNYLCDKISFIPPTVQTFPWNQEHFANFFVK